mmetsp:Transcript_27324/g.38654  ORF Transcript_27324/g.38654 Transcript_27324/m.38654 type:complete len:165 (-) Transcript_27324:419-913(-)|eukprot:CAMPEP_0175092824 /NCGR_PEP_ID=MMETSP0086_2-20121207/2669_1 /TAXON_ID=136419 /ORGANISM="Unknown Unknown, Strain D1" /LENGTH=164 /DNA_ID=CAMNT_0016365713 /DNA_START=37 /DNA_END=534 /DNA_ORIENTATION=+
MPQRRAHTTKVRGQKKFRQGVSTYFDDYKKYNHPTESAYVSPYSQKMLRRKKPHRDEAYAWAVGPGYTEPYDCRANDPFYARHRNSQAWAASTVQPGSGNVRQGSGPQRQRPGSAPVKRKVPSYASGTSRLSAYNGNQPVPYFRFATPYPPAQRPPVVYSYVAW